MTKAELAVDCRYKPTPILCSSLACARVPETKNDRRMHNDDDGGGGDDAETHWWHRLSLVRENAEKREQHPALGVFVTLALVITGVVLAALLIADYVNAVQRDAGWGNAGATTVRVQCTCRFGCLMSLLGTCTQRANGAAGGGAAIAANATIAVQLCAGATELLLWRSNVTIMLQTGVQRRIDGYCVDRNRTYTTVNAVVRAAGAVGVGRLVEVGVGGNPTTTTGSLPPPLAAAGLALTLSTTALPATAPSPSEQLLSNRHTTVGGVVTTQLTSVQRTALAVNYCFPPPPADATTFTAGCIAVNLFPLESQTTESRNSSLIGLFSLLGGLINGILLTGFRLGMRLVRRCTRLASYLHHRSKPCRRRCQLAPCCCCCCCCCCDARRDAPAVADPAASRPSVAVAIPLDHV